MLNDQAQVVYAARLRDVEPPPEDQVAASGALAEQSGVSWVPFTDDKPFHGQIMQLDASPVPLADDDPVVPGSIVGLGLFCAKDLQWEDRVEFSDDREDWYGMPAMQIHYALTERGLDWLSPEAPREINEIESLMREREPEMPGGGKCGGMGKEAGR